MNISALGMSRTTFQCHLLCPPCSHSPFPCNHASSAGFCSSADTGSFRHRGWGSLGQLNTDVKAGLRELCTAGMATATTSAAGSGSWGSLSKGSNCFLLCTGTIGVSFSASSSASSHPSLSRPLLLIFGATKLHFSVPLWMGWAGSDTGKVFRYNPAFWREQGLEKLSSCTLRQMKCVLV